MAGKTINTRFNSRSIDNGRFARLQKFSDFAKHHNMTIKKLDGDSYEVVRDGCQELIQSFTSLYMRMKEFGYVETYAPPQS